MSQPTDIDEHKVWSELVIFLILFDQTHLSPINHNGSTYYLVIWPLLLGKATLVHTIVYRVVYELIDLINGCPEVNRVEVQTWVPGDTVELGVEHPDDLGALVVHHRLELLVPQDLQWNSKFSSLAL